MAINNPNQPNQQVQGVTSPVTPQKKLTGFTNLQQIMGASGNNRIGQAVGQGLQNVSGELKGTVSGQYGKFKTQAEQNRLGSQENTAKRQQVLGQYVNPNQPALNEQNATNPAPASTAAATSSETPQQFQNLADPNQEQIDMFSKFRAGKYEGPSALSEIKGQGIDQLKQRAQELESLANLSSDAGGRQALVQRFIGGPGYSQGSQKLDTMLMGAGDQSALSKARRGLTGITQDITNKEKSAAGLADLYRNEAAKFGADTEEQLTSGLSGITSDVTARAGQYSQGMKDLSAQLGQGLSSGALTQDAFNKLSKPAQDYLNSIMGKGTLASGPEAAAKYKYGSEKSLDMAGFDPTKTIKDVGNLDLNNQADLARLARNDEFQRQKALEALGQRQGSFLSRFDPSQLDRRQLGQYLGTDVNLLASEDPTKQGQIAGSGTESYQAARTLRQTDIDRAKEAEIMKSTRNVVPAWTGELHPISEGIAKDKDMLSTLLGSQYFAGGSTMNQDQRSGKYINDIMNAKKELDTTNLARTGNLMQLVQSPDQYNQANSVASQTANKMAAIEALRSKYQTGANKLFADQDAAAAKAEEERLANIITG